MVKDKERAKFCYEWTDSVWLLHLAVNKKLDTETVLKIIRNLHNDIIEENIIFNSLDSLKRILITKKYSDEKSIELFLPDNCAIKIFEILDRAHYPNDPIFILE